MADAFAGMNGESAKLRDQNGHGDGPDAKCNPGDQIYASKNDNDERKIFVGGLAWETSEKDLRDYFIQFGKILDCTLKTDPTTGRGRGFGFVLFEDASAARQVLATPGHMLNGKQIDPKRAKAEGGREPILKVFVGGLDPNVPEVEIRAYFEKYGKVVNLELPFDKQKNQRRAFCFVTFESEEIVDKVCEQSKQEIGGKSVDVKKAWGPDRLPTLKVFVGGLDPSVSENDIREYFSKYGKVVELELPFDKEKNQRRSFCFVIFDSELSADKACRRPKQELGGKMVDVKKAVPPGIYKAMQSGYPAYDFYGYGHGQQGYYRNNYYCDNYYDYDFGSPYYNQGWGGSYGGNRNYNNYGSRYGSDYGRFDSSGRGGRYGYNKSKRGGGYFKMMGNNDIHLGVHDN